MSTLASLASLASLDSFKLQALVIKLSAGAALAEAAAVAHDQVGTIFRTAAHSPGAATLSSTSKS